MHITPFWRQYIWTNQ